ncbi:MAG: hypothetical protein AAF206_00610 [Bacteroidota bacterium]
MKRTIFFSATMIAAAMFLTSCDGGKLKQLEQENQKLQAASVTQDSVMNDLLSTLSEFESNLDLIREREEMIELTSNDPEMRKDGSSRINDDLMHINTLLDQNRGLIEELQAKVDNGGIKNRKLRNSIANLNKRLEDKNVEIASLTQRVDSMGFAIETLTTTNAGLVVERDTLINVSTRQMDRIETQTAEIETQSARIAEQTKTINTAFYASGSKKELKDRAILEGKRFNAEVTRNSFSAIDITETETIPLDAKKVKLLTPHPEGTYEVISDEKRVVGLEIKNPEAFWRNSKYLVVQTD